MVEFSPESGVGLTREQAIEVCGPSGEQRYLKRLRCPNDKTPSFERSGSVGNRDPLPDTEEAPKQAFDQMFWDLRPGETDYHMLDRCVVTCPGKTYTMYFDMYHCSQPDDDRAPGGFTLSPRPRDP